MNIYIAEDDKIVRRGLREIVSALDPGYAIVGEASNGRIALEEIPALGVDLVITDIKMPAVDGIELIRRLKGILPSVKIIVLSGFNEFDYVRESLRTGAVDYLLKPIDPLKLGALLAEMEEAIRLEKEKEQALHTHQQLIRHLSFLKEEYLLQHLSKPDANPRLMLPFMNDLLALRIDQYLMILVSAEQADGDEADVRSIQAQLEGSFQEEINCLVTSHVLNAREVLFLVLGSAISASSLLQLCIVKLYKGVSDGELSSATFGLSRVYGNFEQFRQAFQEASVSLSQKYYWKDEPIICYTPAFERADTDTDPLRSPKLQSLVNLVKVGNAAKARTEFEEKLTQLEALKLTPVKLKDSLIRLMQALVDGEPDAETMSRIQNSDSYEETKAYLLDRFDRLLGGLEGKSDKNRAIEIAKAHIAKNYFMDLTLKTLADLVYLNPNYFSELFKSSTGKNFVDYLTETRIEAAKKLLADAELKIYQVASLVGYQETVSLNRAFKKVTGITPGEYRNHLL